MGNGFELGSDEPFDPAISLGVPPLMSLEAQRTPPTSIPGARTVRPTAPSDPDDDKRELLATILLSLGQIGGGQPPAFLTNMLRDKAILRRQERTQQGLLYRQEEAASRKEAATEAKTQKMSQAALDVNELAVRTGVESIDMSVRLAMEQHLIRGGWQPKDARDHVLKNLDIKWEQSKDGKTMIGTRNDGGNPFQIPLETTQSIGQRVLLRMKGNKIVGKIAEQPEIFTLPAEHGGVMTKPGVQITPGQGSQVTPQQGTVQPVGGIAPVQGVQSPVQSPEVPQTLIHATKRVVETPLTAEQRMYLSGGPFAQSRTFEELDRQGGGGALRQAIESAADKKELSILNRQDQLMRARIKEMGEEWDRKETARREMDREKKETDPLNERARYWFNPTTYQAAPSDLSPREAKAQGFKPLDPRQVRTVESIQGIKNTLDQAWQVALRHPEWFFRRTGAAVVDKAMEVKVGGTRWMQSSHPDAGTLAALGGRLAQFARASGDDRVSNMDTTLQQQATGIGQTGPMTPGMSLEALHGRVKSIYDSLNSQLKVLGLGQLTPPAAPVVNVKGSKLPRGRNYNNRSFGD